METMHSLAANVHGHFRAPMKPGDGALLPEWDWGRTLIPARWPPVMHIRSATYNDADGRCGCRRSLV